MTETISANAAAGIKAINKTKRCQMTDHATVAKIAQELGYEDLVTLIAGSVGVYQRCLVHGFVAEEVPEATETTEEISSAEGTQEEDVEISEKVGEATPGDPPAAATEEAPSTEAEAAPTSQASGDPVAGAPAEGDTAES